MAKPMLVTLPFVLLLLDYWPLRRFQDREAGQGIPSETLKDSSPAKQKRKSKKHLPSKEKVQVKKPTASPFQWTLIRSLLWEKVPFFILAAIASVVTYLAQQKGGAVSSLKAIPLDARITNAIVSYISYIGKMIWPANLAVFYPHPGMLPSWQVLGAALLLVIVTLIVLRMARSFPYAFVGWLWYLGTLVPVIGIVQVGLQGVADRYTYVPLIGLFIMIAWGVPDLLKKWRYKKVTLAVLSLLILAVMAIGTWKQVNYWQSSFTLFERTLEVTSNNYVIHNALGLALSQRGKIEEVRYHYAEALRIDPRFPDVHNNLGIVFFNEGKVDEAISHYKEAIRINPNHGKAIWNLGNALLRKGKREEASVQYARVLQMDAEDTGAHLNLGNIRASQGKLNEAMTHFREAIRIKDDNVRAIIGLGNALAMQGNVDEAMVWYSRAVKIAPTDAEVHYDMGTIMASQGKLDEAIAYFREAIRISPDYAKAHNNLGSVLLLQGKIEDAIIHFREALRFKPDYRMAQENLRNALAMKRKIR
jgi:tetratricopeptide (TPR) repeat protein